MQRYCCGFAFSKGDDLVLLIQKNRPDWQRGRFNGIGGKIEFGETPLDAMIRETKEETGLEDLPWEPFAVLSGMGWEVFFFVARNVDVVAARQLTDEMLAVCPSDALPNNVIPNLKALIPLALDKTIARPIWLTDNSVRIAA